MILSICKRNTNGKGYPLDYVMKNIVIPGGQGDNMALRPIYEKLREPLFRTTKRLASQFKQNHADDNTADEAANEVARSSETTIDVPSGDVISDRQLELMKEKRLIAEVEANKAIRVAEADKAIKVARADTATKLAGVERIKVELELMKFKMDQNISVI